MCLMLQHKSMSQCNYTECLRSRVTFYTETHYIKWTIRLGHTVFLIANSKKETNNNSNNHVMLLDMIICMVFILDGNSGHVAHI